MLTALLKGENEGAQAAEMSLPRDNKVFFNNRIRNKILHIIGYCN